MDKFAQLPNQERHDILQEAASQRGMTDIILEKDFWVCWTLKQLFVSPALSPYLTFKGGTSLSKAYGLIERFSEDIDLTISRDAPFLKDGLNPMEAEISGKERERRIETLSTNAKDFVREIALKDLSIQISTQLGENSGWSLVLDPNDPDQQTVLFYYPKVFEYSVGLNFSNFSLNQNNFSSVGYIRPHIKLEFGARGDIVPHESRRVIPYVAENFPNFFSTPYADVTTLSVDRTFWEKATILHALHHGSKIRDRMSRHYYDTYMLYKHGIAKTAMNRTDLLEQVVQNKSLMFRDAKASYDTAKIGSLKILPKPDQIEVLKSDYSKMEEMFMGEHPDFDELLSVLGDVEHLVNT
jgi:hypothetical protein